MYLINKWKDEAMGSKGNRAPRRTATRRSPSLRVVATGAPTAAQPAEPADGEVSVGAGSEAELLAAVTESLLLGIAAARHPLAAELVLCDVFGTVESSFPDDADDDDRVEALTAMVSGVIERADALATMDALALLRVCAVLGPPPTRSAASDSVRRVVAHGTSDRPWARRVGSPMALRAWHYGDVLGAQSSIGVLFDYQGREHALMVLIDHFLGGGIKDCWVAEGRAAKNIRDNVAVAMATEPNAIFEDIDLGSAAELLAAALANPPCPEQDDQIEDVARHLYLAQARQQQLALLAGLPPAPLPVAPAATIGTATRAGALDILQIKVSLRGIRPPVWRRLEVPATMTLARLHDVLQVAFGWTDSHLHSFETTARAWGSRVMEGTVLRRTRLDSVAGAAGDKLIYRYDYGDDWTHVIEVEARHAAEPGVHYPTCTAGRQAGPPEDCGGAPGYARLLEAISDPENPDHEELTEWAPPSFDPTFFDRSAINEVLQRFSPSARRSRLA